MNILITNAPQTRAIEYVTQVQSPVVLDNTHTTQVGVIVIIVLVSDSD